MMIKVVLKLITCFLIFCLIQSCAKIANPSGGPKDIYPPEFVNSFPNNRSTNFNEDEISIYFNEYIKINNPNSEILISPPMKEKPVVRVREKSLRITFNEELKPETTYTLNFGKSLADLNEENLLPDFEYVFSTGSVIDSLSISGAVKDAFTNKHDPKTNLFVMLYRDSDKTIAYKKVPDYYGKVSDDGIFAVNNLRTGTYRVIAIEDLNNNLTYERSVERMAFLDSVLNLTPANVTRQNFIKDTVKIITSLKSKKTNKDTTQNIADTIIAPGKIINTVNLSLRYFLEESNKVFLTSNNRESKEKFSFIFNRPLYDDIKVKPLNFTSDSTWYLLEQSLRKDTFDFWILDPNISSKDTLTLQVTYLTTDSSGIFSSRIDTLNLKTESVNKESRNSNSRRNKNEEKKSQDTILVLRSSVLNNGIVDLNRPITFNINRPLKNIIFENIELYKFEDSLFIPQPFEIERESLLKTFKLKNGWIEDTKYKLLLKPGTVYDIYGLTNDSIEINFTSQKEDYYGKILLNLTSFQYPIILQLINSKNAVVKYINIDSPGIVSFDFLDPGNYSFKAIYDINKNGKWDSGDFLKNIQPEEVYISNKPEQLRSNWDLELTWNISKQLQ